MEIARVTSADVDRIAVTSARWNDEAPTTTNGGRSSDKSASQRLDALMSRLEAMKRDNREMSATVVMRRHTEHCKRAYVVDVLCPEAQQCIAEEPFFQDPSGSGGSDAAQGLARATIAVHSKTGSASSAMRASQDLNRANQLAVLNPLVEQLRRLSDAYLLEAGAAPTSAAALASAASVHEGARRGL